MAKSDLQSGSFQSELGANNHKQEDKEPPQQKKSSQYLSKFSLNCTFSLNTKELKQKAYVLSPEMSPSEILKRKKTDSSEASGSKKHKSGSGGEDSDEELREPTAEELAESQEPKNMLSIITIREMKRQNHRKNINSKDGREIRKNVQRIKDYLQKWKNNRTEWKFEKLRQISLIEMMFDEEKINSELWPIALEYLSSTRGSAKDKIIEKAQKEIHDIDDEVESTGDNDLTNQSRYRRAREVLQNLQ